MSTPEPVARPTHGPRKSPHLAETISLGVAGFAMLATARLGWVAEGAGSTLNGQELADSLRNGALVPEGGKWVAAAMYVLFALGGVLLASSGFGGRVVASARLVAGIAIAVPLVFAAIAGWFPLGRWSFGPTFIVAACLGAAVVSVLQLVRSTRTVSDPLRA